MVGRWPARGEGEASGRGEGNYEEGTEKSSSAANQARTWLKTGRLPQVRYVRRPWDVVRK